MQTYTIVVFLLHSNSNYTMSQKTSHLWLAITLMHMNGFWHFLVQMLPIK